jgi:hypothetical protein
MEPYSTLDQILTPNALGRGCGGKAGSRCSETGLGHAESRPESPVWVFGGAQVQWREVVLSHGTKSLIPSPWSVAAATGLAAGPIGGVLRSVGSRPESQAWAFCGAQAQCLGGFTLKWNISPPWTRS